MTRQHSSNRFRRRPSSVFPVAKNRGRLGVAPRPHRDGACLSPRVQREPENVGHHCGVPGDDDHGTWFDGEIRRTRLINKCSVEKKRNKKLLARGFGGDTYDNSTVYEFIITSRRRGRGAAAACRVCFAVKHTIIIIVIIFVVVVVAAAAYLSPVRS